MEFLFATVDEVKILVSLGYDVNYTDEEGKSVLQHACKKGNLNIVKVLCEAGANINKYSWTASYPIDIAARAGNLEIVKYFIENYPDIKRNSVMMNASIKGNIDVLDYLLTLNLDLNSQDYNPLLWACAYSQIDVIDKLLNAGANTNIDCGDLFGRKSTALVIATRKNRLDIVKRLVMFGADYHTYGGHALLISCKHGFDEISEFLIELGCNVNYCIKYITPLMHATAKQKNNNLKIVKLLLERGADPNFVNDNGKKAIDYCSSDEVRALFIKN